MFPITKTCERFVSVRGVFALTSRLQRMRDRTEYECTSRYCETQAVSSFSSLTKVPARAGGHPGPVESSGDGPQSRRLRSGCHEMARMPSLGRMMLLVASISATEVRSQWPLPAHNAALSQKWACPRCAQTYLDKALRAAHSLTMVTASHS